MTSSNADIDTSDDNEFDAEQTAQSIQDQIQQYKLSTTDAMRFPGFTNDAETVLAHIRKGYTQAADIAIDLEQMNKDSSEAQELVENVSVYIDAEHDLETQKSIFQQLSSRIQSGEAINDPVAAYNQLLQREQAKYHAMSAKKKYYSNRQFQDFRQAIWDVHHRNEAMPTYTPAGQVDTADDDDDDLVVGQGRRSMKCPITAKWYEDPVTSQICGHSYSRDAIMSLIRQRRGRCVCPVAGCNKMLDQNVLYDDTMLERSVERAIEEDRLRAKPASDYLDIE